MLENYGTLIKTIRQEKGLSQKDVYDGIMTRQSYYLIENNISFPAFDKFLLILEKLFLTVNEFLDILDSSLFPNENQLYFQLSQAVLKKDQLTLQLLIRTATQLYQETQNKKYEHFQLIARAMLQLNFPAADHAKLEDCQSLMEPIKNYLLAVDNWYLYELKLLNNALYCFNLSEACSLVLLVVKKIDTYPQHESYQTIKLKIYLNISFLCLKAREFNQCMFFAKIAKEHAQIRCFLFEAIIATLNFEIAFAATSQLTTSKEIEKNLNMLEAMDFTETVKEYRHLLTVLFDAVPK